MTLAEAYAALAYFEDHREELRAATEAEARTVAEFEQRHANLKCDLRVSIP